MIEIFTGNGRGKTSAALGLTLRAVGHGLRVRIISFMKGDYPYGEHVALSRFPEVTISQFGHEGFVNPRSVTAEEKEQAYLALMAAREAIFSGEYDLVILDEINVAVAWGLLETEEVVGLVKGSPEATELILTGRYADPRLIELADLVTEMVEVKHPYQKGVLARRGFDY